MRRKAICVFCGSSFGNDPKFAEAARELGTLIANHGYGMVFGGGGLGLMGETARAARDAGAPVVGVIPGFLRHLEPPMRAPDELIVVPTLFARKERMIELADAFIVLPGGIGTADEFFEVLGAAQLGQHSKPIVVLNLDGYFAPLEALIDHIIRTGFAHYEFASHYKLAATPRDAMAALNAAFMPP
ncbi:MAG TPA: TIGR00730 family Rossman fold protein [Rhizomicrobium sp.]